ncbi:MAG TPA: TIM-barrel domain-containing protein [Solirubrobacterales bacterium]|nr:TIM-barrel domain-containing protein [Solirubrobacterales bacterium]
MLSPTLFRLEYAADGNFNDAPTLTAISRKGYGGKVRTNVADGVRVIKTSKAILRYRVGSGPFNPSNLSLTLKSGKRSRTVTPAFGAPSTARSPDPPVAPTPPFPGDPSPRTQGNLGGWFRALDGQSGAVPLHDGILSRDGWYLLDDTISPLLVDGGRWYQPRPERTGPYQDGYLFAYGHDYERALRDFRNLTGPAPLLPRTAFGNWFSQYTFFSARAYQKLLARFRAERVPLDVLVVDTDAKAPNSWNGWGWTDAFGKSPPAFLNWAHSQGLDVAFNVHPSISEDDPAFPGANQIAGGLEASDGCRAREFSETATCRVWDWARREHVESYFSVHAPFEADGIDFWWLDWNGDESDAEAPGLTPDAWINNLYAQRSRDRGRRWPVLSRIGSSMWNYAAPMPGVWAEHRSTIHFTGDAFGTWAMLDFQIRMTAAEGAGIGLPYVSHDIGSFHARKLRDDMYVRWLQFGAFQPILRLHSDHGFRLPWQYGGRAKRIARGFLRLRGTLVPYLYTLGRQAYDTGLPLARPMYLGWPGAGAAYRFDGQYMLGDSLLVAPVAKPGKRVAKRVWFPPGEWVDTFTGQVHRGAGAKRIVVPLDRMAVFARAGSIVPRQPYTGQSNRAQARELTLDVYPGGDGGFTLYEDSGDGFGFEQGQAARTRLSWNEGRRSAKLSIGKAKGGYPGQPKARRYEARVATKRRPDRVTLDAGGKARKLRWSYDREADRVVVKIGRLPTGRGASVRFEF